MSSSINRSPAVSFLLALLLPPLAALGYDGPAPGAFLPTAWDAPAGAKSLADSDGDGMDDGWETNYFGSSAVYAGGEDPDGDGLTNLDEYLLDPNLVPPHLSPLDPDSDDDFLPDGWEVDFALDPLDGAILSPDGAWGDPDGDHLNNLEELYGQDGTRPDFLDGSGDETDPRRPDTDDDGIDEDGEIGAGSSPVESMDPRRRRSARIASADGLEVPDPVPLSASNLLPAVTAEYYRPDLLPRDWTLECFVKLADTNCTGELLQYLVPVPVPATTSFVDRAGYRLSLRSNVVAAGFHGAGSDLYYDVVGPALPTCTWTHLAAVWDHDIDRLSLYVDGTSTWRTVGVDSVSYYGGLFGLYATNPVRWCASTDGSFTNGLYIDEIRIWNTARGADQLAAWRHRILPDRTNGLLASFRFDDGGDSAEDFTRRRTNALFGAASPRYPFGDPDYAIQTNGAFAFTTSLYATVWSEEELGGVGVDLRTDDTGPLPAGARWQLDGGPWMGDGDTVPGLVPGAYRLSFDAVTNWFAPTNRTVTVPPGTTVTVTATYSVARGWLRVDLQPPAAVADGAQWRVDGGAWSNGGATARLRLDTVHTLDYRPLAAWAEPPPEQPVLAPGVTTVLTRTYGTYSVSGRVSSVSAWTNTDPPPGDGTGSGSLLVGLWDGSQFPTAAPLAADSVLDTPALPFAPGTNDFLISPASPGHRFVMAWVDADSNGAYQVGEPRSAEVWFRVATQDVGGIVLVVTDDADGDGLGDWWEAHWFGHLFEGPKGDPDGDGLRNLAEFDLDLDPSYWDSDGNDVSDYDEDGDADELSNGEEQDLYGTDPADDDTDDDTVLDGEELDPLTDKADGRGLTSPVYSRSPLVQRSLVLDGTAVPVPGLVGGALADRFDISPWTVQCWVRPGPPAQTGDLICRETSAGRTNFALRLDANVPSILFTTETGVEVRAGGLRALPYDAWTHLAGVWDPDHNVLSLHINGVSYQGQVSVLNCARGSGRTFLGRGVTGRVDDVMIWRTPRSAEAVAASIRRFALPPTQGGGQRTAGPALAQLPAARQSDVRAAIDEAEQAATEDGGRWRAGYSPVLLRDTAQLCGRGHQPGLPPPPAAHVYADPPGIPPPSGFDWTSAGAVTPVKDQGSCGSCWAFGTVGAFESAILIADGEVTDLSEQHLLSCNLDDWNCIGGLPAHKYHFDTPSSDGGIGAVLEADFPYAAVETTCPGTYPRPYVLANWAYLGDGPFDRQVPDQLVKQAIMAHGPVVAAVYAGSAFTAYAGGIFNTHEESPTGYGNHCILMVGWDDAQGYWIIKNSWGTGWGESGFMRIAYGTSGIGEGPSFVVYGATNAGGYLVARYPFDDGGDTAEDYTRPLDRDYALGGVGFDEKQYASLPGFVDLDEDGIADWWERLLADGNADPAMHGDLDSLNALYEFYTDSNPAAEDTDNNGTWDDAEDFDDDELRNGEEQLYGSDPRLKDTDDDGLTDAEEHAAGFDPADALDPGLRRGLDLPGSPGAYAELDLDPRFALEEWTAEAWIQPSNQWNGGGTLLRREIEPGETNYFLAVDDQLRPAAGFGRDTLVVTSTVPADGVSWTHLAATYQTEGRWLKLYVNGSLAGARVCSANPRFSGLGPVVQRAGEGFGGLLDELRIWDVARAQDDIDAERWYALPGVHSNLVAYYRMDDGTSFEAGLTGTSREPSWQRGQIEDFVDNLAGNWMWAWSDAATLAGGAWHGAPDAGFPTEPFRREAGIVATLRPNAATAAGAMWQVAGHSDWNESGVFIPLAPGTYEVAFLPLAGWVTPATTTVAVVENASTHVTAVYYGFEILGAFGGDEGEFNNPRGLAIDADGFLYVADSDNHRIQRLDPTTGTWTVWGELGTGAGEFNQPFGLSVDGNGNLYVADANNNRVQRRDAGTGNWTVWGGTSIGADPGDFNGPFDVALDGAGNLYVADHYNHRVQKRTPGGDWSVFVDNGFEDGKVKTPRGLAVDDAGELYVSDFDLTTLSRIQQFAADGSLVARLGSSEPDEGGLSRPRGLDPDTVAPYCADTYNDRVAASTGPLEWVTVIGPNILNRPEDVVLADGGVLYVADTGNHRVLRVALDPPPDVQVLGIPKDAVGAVLEWVGKLGMRHTLQYTESLADPDWRDVPGFVEMPGVNGIMTADLSAAPFKTAVFFRLVTY